MSDEIRVEKRERGWIEAYCVAGLLEGWTGPYPTKRWAEEKAEERRVRLSMRIVSDEGAGQ